jgi:hypothetical protein
MQLVRELTQDEFLATCSAPMRDVTSTAEEVVDLWAYADPVLTAAFPEARGWEWRVKHVRESGSGEFQPALVPLPVSNVYYVIVIDKRARRIHGHYRLALGEQDA